MKYNFYVFIKVAKHRFYSSSVSNIGMMIVLG